MAISAGELFVTIGIKGAEVAGKAIQGINKQMKDLGSNSFVSKAAIMGMLYGFGRLAEFAAGNGMQMMKFANYTGISTDLLQRWQYAGLKAGVSADEMANSLQGVQSAMSAMQSGAGAPKGWATISTEVGIDYTKINDMKYMMEKLQQYAKTTKTPIGLANEYLKSMGLGEATIAMIRRNVVEIDKIPRSLILSTKELERQSKIKAQWDTLWKKGEIKLQRFITPYAEEAIKDLEKSFNWIENTIKNVIDLKKEVSGIGPVFATVSGLLAVYMFPIVRFAAIIEGIIYLLSEYQKHRKGEESLFGKAMTPEELKEFKESPYKTNLKQMLEAIKHPKESFNEFMKMVTPENKELKPNDKMNSKDISMNIYNNFNHDAMDHMKTGQSIESAVKNGFYQMQTQTMIT